MHIPDGVLTAPVLASTGLLAAAGVAIGVKKLEQDQVPRAGIISAVFFTGSLLHVPIGPASAHLVFIGLSGVLLGWAVFPAFFTALLLQKIFFQFGGIVTLGANTLNHALPAFFCWMIFKSFTCPQTKPARLGLTGFAAGFFGVATASLMTALTLFLSGRQFLPAASAILIAHIPVACAEGAVTASVLTCLAKVKPDILENGIKTYVPQDETKAHAA